jgi:hypothetical protein
LKPRLYIETNFLVGYAKEQHAGQDDILALSESGSLDLRLPSVAIMEAYKSWERDRERSDRTRRRLQDEIRDVQHRKFLAPGARDFTDSLDKADGSIALRLDRARSRTAHCVHVVARSGKLIDLPVTWGRLDRSDALIRAEPDDMILACIISDASVDDRESMLLTENSDDFEQPSVKDALTGVGVRYMYDTADVLSRIRSLLP